MNEFIGWNAPEDVNIIALKTDFYSDLLILATKLYPFTYGRELQAEDQIDLTPLKPLVYVLNGMLKDDLQQMVLKLMQEQYEEVEEALEYEHLP
jgi:hypothetical protein